MKKNEQLALRYFVTELRTAKGKDSAITVGYLVDRWNMANPKKKIDDTGGKRIIRHIRNEGIIKRLMADNYGYFIADNREAYERYLDMLHRRAKRVMNTYKAMANQ